MSSTVPPVGDRVPIATEAVAPRPTPPSNDGLKGDVALTLYFSPVVRLDPETEIAVWQFRDPTSGKVVEQYPAERTVAAYRAHALDNFPIPAVYETVSGIVRAAATVPPVGTTGYPPATVAPVAPATPKPAATGHPTNSGRQVQV